MTRKKGRKIPVTARCSQADFHKFVAGLLKGVRDDPDIIELQERLATAGDAQGGDQGQQHHPQPASLY